MQRIARTQGWKLFDVQALWRVADQLGAHQQIPDADWNALVKAIDEEPIEFGETFLGIICTTYPMDERFRPTVLKYCEQNMKQEEFPKVAVDAYFCYALAKGPNPEEWKTRLIARGGIYPERMATQEKILEKWQKKFARLEHAAQR